MMINWNLIVGILIISGPILFSMIAFPDSIAWSWNEGRGGYFFALVFVVAELVGLENHHLKKTTIICDSYGCNSYCLSCFT